jgi:hypothetical protein
MADWRPATAAERAVIEGQILELAQERAALLNHQIRVWASITFAGSRHKLDLSFAGEDAVAAGEMFVALLPEHEFDFPGHLCADASVLSLSHEPSTPSLNVAVELLLLDEAQS